MDRAWACLPAAVRMAQAVGIRVAGQLPSAPDEIGRRTADSWVHDAGGQLGGLLVGQHAAVNADVANLAMEIVRRAFLPTDSTHRGGKPSKSSRMPRLRRSSPTSLPST